MKQPVLVLNHSLIPNSPLTASHIPSLSLNFQPLSFRMFRILVCRGSPISSNNTKAIVHEKQYPWPAEIQWKKELCNSVQLIGFVVKPVQIRHLSSRKVITWSRLAVKKSQHQTGWYLPPPHCNFLLCLFLDFPLSLFGNLSRIGVESWE